MRGRLLFSRRSSAMALVIVLAGAVTACGAPGLPSNTNLPTAEQTAKVTRGTIRTTIGASGVVAALQEVLLNFPSGTTVKTVTVVVGQRVNVSDILGTSDTSDLMLTLQQQQANVASAQAKYDQVAAGSTQKDIDVAQAAVDAAKAKYQATATILPKDIQTAQANLDSARAKYQAAATINPKDIEVARANVDAAKAKYQATATINPKDIEVARANLDAAKAKYQAAATINPKDIQVARANLDQAIASYNAIILGTTTPQDIANAEAAVRSAQAKLDALRAGPLKADVISAQSKLQQAQQNVDKVKSDSANTKEQALITWQKSADATRSAQRAFDIANATYQQAKSTNVDPGATGGGGSSASGTSTTKATAAPPTITPLKLDTLKQAADSAYLTEQQAEKTQEANRLAYENTKNAEINNNATAQQQVNDAQSAVSKLVAGPTNEDVTQAQATIDQAKAQLDKLKRGPTDADVAKAQANVDSARATLNDLLAGPKATDLAQAQSAVDSAQAALNDLQAGPKATDLQQAQSAVDSAQATLNDLLAGPKATDLAQAQSAVDTAQAALNDLQAGPKATDLQQAQANVNSAQATLNDLTAGAKTPDLETALAALDQAKAQRDLAQLNIDKATIRAPFAGLMTQVNVVPGQIGTSGTSASGTTTASLPAFDLVDDSHLHIDVSVSESDAANVQVGQAALISLDSVPGQMIPGSVERVSPVATTTSNVTAFPVRIAIAPTQAPVKPGANATVQIVTATRTNALTVPVRAVTQINGQPAATILFNGSTFLVPIRTGLSDGRNIEVLSGLNEGDTVVLPKAGTGSTGGAPGGGAARPGG